MHSRKSKRTTSKQPLLVQNKMTTSSIPMLPYIFNYLGLIDWVSLVNVSHDWHALLNDRSQELVKLKVLPVLRLLYSYQDLLLETLNKILKALESSSVTFQVELLRAAIYHLQNPASFIPDLHLLFPGNAVQLYDSEILDDKPKITSVTRLASDEEKERTFIFNNVMRELHALYTSHDNVLIDDQADDPHKMKNMFIAKLKEKYLYVKYSFRDKHHENDSDLLSAINTSINASANDAQAEMKKITKQLSTGEIIFYTLIILNTIIAFYRIYNSPRDWKNIILQACGPAALILVPSGGVKLYHELKRDRAERLTLFSAARNRGLAQRTDELKTLLTESDVAVPASPRL